MIREHGAVADDDLAGLTLRPLCEADEDEARRTHEELAADGFEFLLGGWHSGRAWADHLVTVERERTGVDLPEDRVPATFLVAELDGQLVGRVSIRHRLNDWLAAYGGHIGYGVRPAFRGRGIATELLRRSLDLAAELVEGDRVLLVCDDGNLASIRVIERCGGVLHGGSADPESGEAQRHYLIDLPATPPAHPRSSEGEVQRGLPS